MLFEVNRRDFLSALIGSVVSIQAAAQAIHKAKAFEKAIRDVPAAEKIFLENDRAIDLAPTDPSCALNTHLAFFGSEGLLHNKVERITQILVSCLQLPRTWKMYATLESEMRQFYRERHGGFGWIYATSVWRSHRYRGLDDPRLCITEEPTGERPREVTTRPRRILDVGNGVILDPAMVNQFGKSGDSIGGRPAIVQLSRQRRLDVNFMGPQRYSETWTTKIRLNTEEEELFREGQISATGPGGYLANGIHPIKAVGLLKTDLAGWQTLKAIDWVPDTDMVGSVRTAYKPWWIDYLACPPWRALIDKMTTRAIAW